VTWETIVNSSLVIKDWMHGYMQVKRRFGWHYRGTGRLNYELCG
jgi:hypothetical protein